MIAEPLRFEMRLIAVIPRRCNYAWHCNGRDRLTPPHCNCERRSLTSVGCCFVMTNANHWLAWRLLVHISRIDTEVNPRQLS